MPRQDSVYFLEMGRSDFPLGSYTAELVDLKWGTGLDPV